MATETTGLLSGCVVYISQDDNTFDVLNESQKLKSLSLEELMPFQDDPWWQNVRRTFFFSFWITLILVFTSACVLSVLQHGSCAEMKSGTPKTTTMMIPIITIPTSLTNGLL